MKQRGLILIVMLLLALSWGCNGNRPRIPFLEEKDPGKKKIARVYDKILYDTDLKGIQNEDINSTDSNELVKAYINNWIKQQVILKKAEDNLTEFQKNIEQQIQDYRNTLIIYQYEKELVNQRLDTNVTEDEMREYFNSHKNNFELKRNILRLNYVKIRNNSPELSKLRMWMKEPEADKNIKLLDYCQKNAENYYFRSNVWLDFNDVIKEIPIKTYDQEQFIQNNKYVEINDENFVYFIKILDFRIKNSVSSFEFEKQNLKNIILNQRKMKLISEMESRIMNEATQNNSYEIY